MTPYHKILRPDGPLHWNGYFQWQINLITPKESLKIPLSFFRHVNPCKKEQKYIVYEQETNSRTTSTSL
jgi:hypothetical protein